jgi:rubrerythrin
MLSSQQVAAERKETKDVMDNVTGDGSGERATGTPNTIYDLSSVLFHALEGGASYDTYIDDAEREGDEELAEFFRRVRDEDRKRADEAQRLLAERTPTTSTEGTTAPAMGEAESAAPLHGERSGSRRLAEDRTLQHSARYGGRAAAHEGGGNFAVGRRNLTETGVLLRQGRDERDAESIGYRRRDPVEERRYTTARVGEVRRPAGDGADKARRRLDGKSGRGTAPARRGAAGENG